MVQFEKKKRMNKHCNLGFFEGNEVVWIEGYVFSIGEHRF